VDLINRKISFFLACNLFIVAVFIVPKYEQGKKCGNTKTEVSTADYANYQGYTKNEIKSAQQNADQSSKDSKSHKHFDNILFDEKLQTKSITLTQLNLLFFAGTIQLNIKALIFPFHSFW
jgi:hypothetical protein